MTEALSAEAPSDPSLPPMRRTMEWRAQFPTIFGLSIIVTFVLYQLIGALLVPDPTSYAGVRMCPLHGGGYWIDPRSLGGLARIIVVGIEVNWIIAVALVLITVLWEKRPLASIGLRMPGAGDALPALAALLAFYLFGYAATCSALSPMRRLARLSMPCHGTCVSGC